MERKTIPECMPPAKNERESNGSHMLAYVLMFQLFCLCLAAIGCATVFAFEVFYYFTG